VQSFAATTVLERERERERDEAPERERVTDARFRT